jgi:1-aminocyclopropane-1-carboxylate deaminase
MPVDLRQHQVELRLPSPLVELRDERLDEREVRVWLKRDDLIHPELPGNKWRKLKYNLAAAAEQSHQTLLTFGGAYSNHIRATAAAGHYFGFSTVGVIRGEEHRPLNPSLAYAVERGMQLAYLDRGAYRAKREPTVLDELRRQCGDFYLVPEGGSNGLGARGCAEITAEIDLDFDVICCPVGTGGTLAGIGGALHPGQAALGFSVLKGATSLDREVMDLQAAAFGTAPVGDWRIDHRFHFGGYAKKTPELQDFIDDFADRHNITLDRIYTAKMMFGIVTLAQDGHFPAGTRLVAVITG